jgi:hypothetical protein
MKYTVMVGNPVDGIELHGVFDTSDDANEYAECADFSEVWWVVPIYSDDDDDIEEDNDYGVHEQSEHSTPSGSVACERDVRQGSKLH